MHQIFCILFHCLSIWHRSSLLLRQKVKLIILLCPVQYYIQQDFLKFWWIVLSMFYVGMFFSFISSNNPTSNVPMNYPQISLLSECWYTDEYLNIYCENRVLIYQGNIDVRKITAWMEYFLILVARMWLYQLINLDRNVCPHKDFSKTAPSVLLCSSNMKM